MAKSLTNICKLCGHTQFKVLFDREFKILVCRNCGLIFIGDRDRDLRKYYSEEYDYKLDEDGYLAEDKKADESIFKWIIKHLPATENLTLLEIGCNTGFLLKRFKDYGINVFGIEPRQKAATFAKRINGISEIKCSMLEDVEEGGRTYDVVILIQTFEHFADPLNSLLKIKTFLKKDGFLFIEVPNYYALNGFYSFKSNGMDYPSPNHLFVYTPRTLSAFLRKAGMSVYKTSYTWRNIRMILKVNSNDETVEFENYYRVMFYFHLLPILHRAIDIFRFFKNKLG